MWTAGAFPGFSWVHEKVIFMWIHSLLLALCWLLFSDGVKILVGRSHHTSTCCYTFIHACMCIHTNACVSTYSHIHTCTYIHTAHMCRYVYTQTCICIHMQACVHVCTHVRIHITGKQEHTHTRAYTHKRYTHRDWQFDVRMTEWLKSLPLKTYSEDILYCEIGRIPKGFLLCRVFVWGKAPRRLHDLWTDLADHSKWSTVLFNGITEGWLWFPDLEIGEPWPKVHFSQVAHTGSPSMR